MKDRRKFIESNRGIFDDKEPLAGHFDRFETLLNSTKSLPEANSKRRLKLIGVVSIAASIAILVGITFKLYTPQSINPVTPIENAIEIDEFRSTNEFYNQKMEEQIADIMCKLAYTDTQNQKQLSEDIQKIISSNSAFVDEMAKNDNPEIAIRYLVRHYKANIERLENINEKLGKYTKC